MSISTDAYYDNVAQLVDFANSLDNLNPIWQSFKSGSNEYFYGVQLYIKTPDIIIGGQPIDAEGVNIIIYNGTGTAGTVFAQLSAANVSATGPTWYTFVFPSPFQTLTIGNEYTIAVSGPGAGDLLWGYSYSTPQSTYPDGEASFQPPSDLFFKVQITPVPVNPNIPNTFNFVEVQDGSAAAPSYTFSNDLTTGLYLDTTTVTPNGVGIAAAGAGIVSVNTQGVIPVTKNIYALGDIQFKFSNLYIAIAGHQAFMETGAIVPTLEGSTGNPTAVAYNNQSGTYVRIGTIVYVQGYVSWTGIGVAGTGTIFINTNIGISPPTTDDCQLSVALDNFSYAAAPNSSLTGNILTTQNIQLIATSSGAASYILDWATDLGLGAAGIRFTGCYNSAAPPDP